MMSDPGTDTEIYNSRGVVGNLQKRQKIQHDGGGGSGVHDEYTRLANGRRKLSRESYTVGWVSALPVEMRAALALLDEVYADVTKHQNDDNTYTLGDMAGHNCVIACLPAGVYGITSASHVASQMQLTFPSIKFWLMVGIGGGAPTEKADIRLGDVVVSVPTPGFPSVVQYDYGKTIKHGHFQPTGTLNKPPQVLLQPYPKSKPNLELIWAVVSLTKLRDY
jgi:hypothetical protein